MAIEIMSWCHQETARESLPASRDNCSVVELGAAFEGVAAERKVHVTNQNDHETQRLTETKRQGLEGRINLGLRRKQESSGREGTSEGERRLPSRRHLVPSPLCTADPISYISARQSRLLTLALLVFQTQGHRPLSRPRDFHVKNSDEHSNAAQQLGAPPSCDTALTSRISAASKPP